MFCSGPHLLDSSLALSTFPAPVSDFLDALHLPGTLTPTPGPLRPLLHTTLSHYFRTHVTLEMKRTLPTPLTATTEPTPDFTAECPAVYLATLFVLYHTIIIIMSSVCHQHL